MARESRIFTKALHTGIPIYPHKVATRDCIAYQAALICISMIWITDIAAALALSQLAMLACYFPMNYRGALAKWMSLFCICLGAYVVTTLSVIEANTLPSFILFRFATLTPFVLWIIARWLFLDSGQIPLSAWLVIAFFVLDRGIGSAIAIGNPEAIASGFSFVLVQLIPQALMFGFTLHAIYLAVYGYSSDLVEQRRKFRVIFVTCAGLLIGTIVGSGIIGYFNGFTMPTAIYSLYIFVATMAFNLTSLRLDDEAASLVPEQRVQQRNQETPAPSQSAADAGIVAKIENLMVQERLFTQAGLTISDLADALSIQEYRLRRIINQSMKHRNFNQFLNSYRIEDARDKLVGSRLAISSVAFEAGYSSLSVFNKAFKDRYGMTPSEYRSQHGQASASAAS
jgi:AraC-like DNA-binding protein